MYLLRDREPNGAYLAARPGAAYALYFPDGGAVELDLQAAPGRFNAHWISIATGEETPPRQLTGGQWVRLQAPGAGHWAAALVKMP